MTLQQFGIAYCLSLMGLMVIAMAIEKRIKRKRWPEGHGDSYFWRPRRYTDTE